MILSIRYSEKEKREIFIDDGNRIYIVNQEKQNRKQNNKTVAKNRKN
jgi:hypothetical protein